MEPQAKRQKNLAIWGCNCDQERQVCILLKDEAALFGFEVLILNDFTHADVLVRPQGVMHDRWLPLQVKTTHGLRRYHTHGKHSYRFSNMNTYQGMPILCASLEPPLRWMFDGSQIAATDIDIKPGGRYDKISEKVDTPEELASVIGKMYETEHFLKTTEHHARWNIKRETHMKEMRVIHLWKTLVADARGWLFRWPNGQGATWDFEYSDDGGKTWRRVQMKTVQKGCAKARASGFHMPLTKQSGYVRGKPTHGPYSKGDADVYIGVHHTDTTFDFWTFLEEDIADRLVSSGCAGKCNMYVHLPSHLSNERVNDGVAKTKGGPPNRSLWTRCHHSRVLCGCVS